MSGVVIGLARPDEYPAVDELVERAYEHDYGPREHSGGDELSRAEVRGSRFDVWVARDEDTGALLGTVTTPSAHGERLMEDSRDDELDFRLLAVSPDARRRRLGEQLTRHVIAVAADRGLAGVFMKSAPNMLGAHALYRKIGFRRDEDRDGLVLGGRVVFDLFAFAIDVPSRAPEGIPG